MQDTHTRIDGKCFGQFVFVDVFDDESIWLSLTVPGGKTHLTLTHDQTKKLIEALTNVMESQNA